jgi:hypothetical protein
MEPFKLASWNIEWADRLVTALASGDAEVRRKAERRRDAIRAEIGAIGADILLVLEGPEGEDRAAAFFADVAPDYRLVIRGGDREAYGMKSSNAENGIQWIWFLVRADRGIDAQLQHLDRWRAYTAQGSRGEHRDGSWEVSYPRWKAGRAGAPGQLLFSVPQTHGHWRHPQVLQAVIDGAYVEIIGCHLKSKRIEGMALRGGPSDAEFFAQNPRLVAELVKARVKLTTEADDVRHYIDARFAEDGDAAIIVAGDLNDGPGKERIERRFLYHDLVGTLQGEVFFAQRFLNHALFDAAEGERWSVHFEDELENERDPKILLDHILFSQPLTRSYPGTPSRYVAKPQGGQVEHEIHHRIASSVPAYAAPSDHKPISMTFVPRDTNPADRSG